MNKALAIVDRDTVAGALSQFRRRRGANFSGRLILSTARKHDLSPVGHTKLAKVNGSALI